MVWSDPEIKKLATEFVTVADEVYMLYPEDPGNLNRVKDRPEHIFFKSYGESMPRGDWNHPGTKQGVYMIGPNAEYLEGRFAASSDIPDLRRRMARALERWKSLKETKGYANLPVPAVESTHPPEISGELILRVFSRDLPRGNSGNVVRFNPETDFNRGFTDYVRWAWNENWIGLPRVTDFVPTSDRTEPVSDAVMRRLSAQVLVDNVRGQVPAWQESQVSIADMTMRRTISWTASH
ncbi:hypothetical protein QM565_27390 [Geitlerinema splendidum]|nr:hypothetical protein [Geitlerinema splendidum]